MEILGRKLSDRIITDGVKVSSFLGPRNEQTFSNEEKRLQQMIQKGPVFYIQNVADYLRTFHTEGRWNGTDLPCVAPPYPSFFMEYRTNPVDLAYQVGVRRAGVLFETLPDKTTFKDHVDQKILDETKWVLSGTVIHEGESSQAFATTTHDLFILDDGRLAGNGESFGTLVCENLGGKANAPEDEVNGLVMNNLGQEVFTGMLAISFLHCHGARTRIEEPPVKVSKRHEKKTGHPLIKYHVIDVDPMR